MLGKKALETGVQVAQDVLEGDHINAALAKHRREAIGGLVQYLGLGVVKELQKEKCSFMVYFQARNEKQFIVLEQGHDVFELWP